MTEQGRLVSGVGFAAWGYLFLIINLEIDGCNLLPNFVGYALLFVALGRLAGRRPPQHLRVLCLVLVGGNLLYKIYDYWAWLPGGWLLEPALGIMDIILRIGVFEVMSALAAAYQPAEAKLDAEIMRYGMLGIALHLVALVMLAYGGYTLGMLAAVAGAGLGFLVMVCLFRLRKLLAAYKFDEVEIG